MTHRDRILLSLIPEYVNILKGYLFSSDDKDRETSLFEASLLGRKLVKHELAPDELLYLHYNAIYSISQDINNNEQQKAIMKNLLAYDVSFLIAELLMAHGIAYRAEMEKRWNEDIIRLRNIEKIIEQNLYENNRLRSIAELAGGIGHDFNNLLGSIIGLTELCRMFAPDGSEMANNLDKAIQVSLKARNLTRQMLDFSRQTPSNMTKVKVHDLIKMSEGLIKASVTNGISFEKEISPQVVDEYLHIDIVKIEQVFYNLCNNAIHAMTNCQAGILKIAADSALPNNIPKELQLASGYVRFQVIDTGEGIPPEIIHRIFDPFFTTKPVGLGTGLGLSSVYGVVNQHGGTVEVASEVGKGTTFSVFFPKVDP